MAGRLGAGASLGADVVAGDLLDAYRVQVTREDRPDLAEADDRETPHAAPSSAIAITERGNPSQISLGESARRNRRCSPA